MKEPEAEALVQACFEGDLDLVISLCQLVGNLNAPGRIWNPLHAAIENMEVAVVRYLLASGADPEFMCGGMRSLHHAVDVEADAAIQANDRDPPDPVLTRLLVDAGADIKGLDESNRTPLEIAKRYGHKKAVALLQSQGAV